MSTTLQNAPLGIMSTPILQYSFTKDQEDKTNYFYQSTLRLTNPDVKFLSESARISAKLGRIRFNQCG